MPWRNCWNRVFSGAGVEFAVLAAPHGSVDPAAWLASSRMKIVYLGSGAFGLPALRALLAAGHEIALIISQPDRPAGRGKKLTPTPVSQFAAETGLPLLATENANSPEMISAVRAAGARCLVVIAFGQKLSDDLLAAAPLGGINLHASLLPKYRGAAPINWAIINDEKDAGVSVIRVTNVMDGGEIFAQAHMPIAPDHTAGILHDALAKLGAPVLVRVIEALADGTAFPLPQDTAQKSGARKLSREDAWIDFGQPAELVSARIRGLSPWPACAVHLMDDAGAMRAQVSLLNCRAQIGQATNGRPGTVLVGGLVACGSGALELLEVQPAGKKAMPMPAFINGYGWKAGWRVVAVQPPR